MGIMVLGAMHIVVVVSSVATVGIHRQMHYDKLGNLASFPDLPAYTQLFGLRLKSGKVWSNW